MFAIRRRTLGGLAAPGIAIVVSPWRARLLFAVDLLLVLLVAAVDFETGYDVRLATLYLIPIGLATWRLGRNAGVFLAIASTLAWIVSFDSLHPYSNNAHFYWEGASKAATFLFIVWLVSLLRRALAHSDARFVTVLDGLAAAVFVEDARGEVLFANPRYRGKFGDARPAMLPRDLADEYAGELLDPAAHRWYLVRSRPLRWIDGRSVCLRLVSDITEEKRVRELMDRHREALHHSARLVALGEFASAIAHEINQPLAAIATYNNTCLRLLESGGGDDAELKRAMEKCREQACRAGAIIRRLRDFLRQREPALVERDLNVVARDALLAAETDVEQAGVTIELRFASVLPKTRMDPLLIEQVLLNLLRNAIEAVQGLAPERRRITVETTAQGAAVALTVSDLGAGVREAVRERLFDAFVTDKPGGLGLGLSICRSVIESHGGRLTWGNSAAGGARFAFILPGID